MILTTYSDISDVLVFTTESGHYCIIVRALKDIKLNDDGTLDATPVYGPFHNEAFACEDREKLHTTLLNIEAAGYQVPWGQLLNRIEEKDRPRGHARLVSEGTSHDSQA